MKKSALLSALLISCFLFYPSLSHSFVGDLKSGEQEEEKEESKEDRQEWREQKERSRHEAMKDRGWLEKSWILDLNYEFGLGLFGRGTEHISYSRFRVGGTRFLEPKAFTLGAIGEIEHTKRGIPAAFGLQLEHLSMRTSAWVQLGSLIETSGKYRFTGGVGWQIFGADFQYRPAASKGEDWSVSGKVRVPINWIVRAIRK